MRCPHCGGSLATLALSLTIQERRVLRGKVEGLTAREIAERMFVAESTVKAHLVTAYRKLGVHKQADAVAVVRRFPQIVGELDWT